MGCLSDKSAAADVFGLPSQPCLPLLPRPVARRYEKQHRHNKLLHLLGGTGAVPQWKGIEAGEPITLHQVTRGAAQALRCAVLGTQLAVLLSSRVSCYDCVSQGCARLQCTLLTLASSRTWLAAGCQRVCQRERCGRGARHHACGRPPGEDRGLAVGW